MAANLIPLALIFLFAAGGRGRRATPRRRIYGPDPLASMAPPVTQDFLIPRRELEPTPEQRALETHSQLPVQQDPIPPATQWNPAQEPPPYAPADSAFYPPLDPQFIEDYPAPSEPMPDAMPEPQGNYSAPAQQWQTPEQVTREQAARSLAQHILTHRGSSRDRALIRRLQTALGVHSDGLIGNETLTAIDRYGRLNEQERAALQPER